MKTPICDFTEEYAQKDPIRLHMPGHKGEGGDAFRYDITEITGADSLYSADGIIRESEKNASLLFNANTFYSTEGSSLSIRAMVYLLALYKGKKPLILAGRNAHKAFVSAVALLGANVKWLYGEESASHLCCRVSAEDVAHRLDGMREKPDAVYITSPDYLGNVSDVEGIAKACHERGVLLLVDNAHGAYFAFLEGSMHPIALGADMCCDSAHKTLPALTGAAYLHISKNAPDVLKENAKNALALFGSTSPSYLILASLDRLNEHLETGYREALSSCVQAVRELRRKLSDIGYTLVGDEPMKLTISTKPYGYLGSEIAQHLEENGIFPEFFDPDFLVLMPSPSLDDASLDRVFAVLEALPKKEKITDAPPRLTPPFCALSIREATFSTSEKVAVGNAKGRVLAAITVGCPPAVPIAICGEVIDDATVACFKYYGISTCLVVKENNMKIPKDAI